MPKTKGWVLPCSLLVLLLSACQGAPVTLVSTTPKPMPDVYACAFRVVNELGYVVSGASRDAGFIAADKRHTGFVQAILGLTGSDRLTMAIFDDAATGGRKLRVTAETINVSQREGGSRVETRNVSDAARADARTIIDSCVNEGVAPQPRPNAAAREALTPP